MLNVNALQKTLSAMSLPEIQKYASMHKDDPYVVAMALSVANTKKQAMLAQQGMAASGVRAQPTVVEQDLASLAAPAAYSEVPYAKGATPTKYEQVPYAEGAAQLPEDSGIGQLPANNLQGMAEGGIVAFGDGGEVPHFDGSAGSRVNLGGVSAIPYYLPGPSSERDRLNALPGQWWDEAGDAITRGWNKFTEGTTIEEQRNAKAAAAAAKAAAAAQAAKEANMPKYDAATQERGAQILAAMNPSAPTADTAPTPDTGAGKKDLGGINKLAPTGAPSVGGAGLGGFMDYLKANKPAGPEDMDAYMKRREAYLGDNPTKKQMERIDKQEAQALADKEEAKAMAIIRAGLGMMSGTSQHAFTNIGQGATAGLEDYIASQKDAKKLKLERDKMRDAVENAAYAYKKGDMDAYEKYAQDAKNAQNTYAAHGLSALGSVTGHQISAAATMAAASMPGAQERLFTSLSDPTSAAAKGLKNYAEIMGPEAKGDTAIRTAAINKWSSEPMLRQEFNNDFNSYLRMMSGQQMVSGATPNQLAALKKYGVSVP